MSEKRKEANESAYLLPNRICATCGKPTGGKGLPRGSYGEFHYDCARDELGQLLTVDERERAA